MAGLTEHVSLTPAERQAAWEDIHLTPGFDETTQGKFMLRCLADLDTADELFAAAGRAFRAKLDRQDAEIRRLNAVVDALNAEGARQIEALAEIWKWGGSRPLEMTEAAYDHWTVRGMRARAHMALLPPVQEEPDA